MGGSKYIKLLGLICGVAAVDIIVFSPGLWGVEIGGSALSAAFGATLLVGSALALLYGSYVLLFRPPAAIPVKQLHTQEDYTAALNYYRHLAPFENDMNLGLQQLGRLNKKKETLLEVLNQRFHPEELSYKKFASVILEVEKLLYANLQSVLNRLQVFDESEYESIMKPQSAHPSQVLQERAKVYHEHLSFVRASLSGNEEILLKLDQLLLEISRLHSLEPGEIEDMPCMQEIDMLIRQTKYYKN